MFTTVAQPDLIVQTPTSAPASPVAGSQMTFTGTVRNQGGSAAGASTARLYININNDASTDDVVTTNQATGALAATATELETWANAWTATAGTHSYRICADAAGAGVVTESNEANNCTASPVLFTVGVPDSFVITHNPRPEPDPTLPATDLCHPNNPQCNIDHTAGVSPARHGHFFRDISIASDDSNPTMLSVKWTGAFPEPVLITVDAVDRDDRTDGVYGTNNCPVTVPPAPAIAVPCTDGVGDAINAGNAYPSGVAIPVPSNSGFSYYFNGDISQTFVQTNPDGLGRYVPVQFNSTLQNATVNVPGRYIIYVRGTSAVTGKTFIGQILLVVGQSTPGYRER